MKPRVKDRWSLLYLPLTGVTAGKWWRLMRQTGFDVDWGYAHRTLFITAWSLINSMNAWLERRRYGDAIAHTTIAKEPLFILGHWRSGTTHLHNLLAQDTAQFAFPNTFQVVNPHTFLRTEAMATSLFKDWMPSRRPMDNMRLAFDLPQEDEFALLLLTLSSPYVGIHLPRRMREYERYFTFEGVAEVAEWRRAVLWFFKKLTFKHGPKALLLKSPPHTARIRLLLELFPKARFVHIHRHPYDVYRSTCHYWNTAPWLSYLQAPDQAVDEGVLRRYNLLYDAFFAQRPLIPPGQFHEVRFEDLESNPIQEIERLYAALGLEGFSSMRPGLEQYVQSLAGYERNRFPSMDLETRSRVAKEWARGFEAWGYPE